jgi:GNAT superfamily N-acetyltransferase
MPDAYIRERWLRQQKESNFHCLLIEVDEQVRAVSWFHDISHQAVETNKGKKLFDFVKGNYPDRPCVWVDATVTDPEFQGRGMATELKQKVLERISNLYVNALILTRMRDDNVGIIKVNEKFGFLRTGVKVSGKDKVCHEYWYRP